MRPGTLKVIIWIGLFFLLLCSAAWPQNPIKLKSVKKKPTVKADEIAPLPEHLNPQEIDHFLAGLSDAEVRHLLIHELKARALQEAQTASDRTKPSGIAGFIDRTKGLTALLEARVEYLRTGGSKPTQQATGIYDFLGRGERGKKTVANVILSAAAVLAAALVIEWLFYISTMAARRHVASTTPDKWGAKIGVLTIQALLDFAAIVVFILAALALFFIFLERTAGQRVIMSTYLAAFVIVQVSFLISRFFLAPRDPALRFLPFTDETALYLHRWVLMLAAVGSFGYLTCGVVRLAGAGELEHLLSTTGISLIMAAMIIWMIMQKRKAAAAEFSRSLPESSLRFRLAQKWYIFAVIALVLLFIFSTINQILGLASGQGMLTFLMVPLYFLMDWILRLILEKAFGLIEENGQAPGPATCETPKGKPGSWKRLDLERVKSPLGATLRLALAVLLFFWILGIWNVDLPIGEEVVKTIIKILVVVLICYVSWGLINAAILRRMRREMPEAEADDEKEEGSGGGSRIGTLLLLLRKFMLVVIVIMAVLIILSALGVNIGPLIAGAGVFGLAIGFGAQTLVKDIISGVFFLMDDAFRVGDYLQVSGSKGTVEHISLRSIRLRNPRGMVNFIPFGDIKLVTNLSRDYVIMKLDFRVRYDADVEKIRKVIKKKVYQKIAEDPDLGPKLLEPIKSQGVRQMDDSAMIMRVKYKTKPGDQFAIRKEVYRLMQEAFKQAGIVFAHRNVTVHLPPATGDNSDDQATDEGRQNDAAAKTGIQPQAAAGAALAAVQAEEEAQPKDKPEK